MFLTTASDSLYKFSSISLRRQLYDAASARGLLKADLEHVALVKPRARGVRGTISQMLILKTIRHWDKILQQPLAIYSIARYAAKRDTSFKVSVCFFLTKHFASTQYNTHSNFQKLCRPRISRSHLVNIYPFFVLEKLCLYILFGSP